MVVCIVRERDLIAQGRGKIIELTSLLRAMLPGLCISVDGRARREQLRAFKWLASEALALAIRRWGLCLGFVVRVREWEEDAGLLKILYV